MLPTTPADEPTPPSSTAPDATGPRRWHIWRWLALTSAALVLAWIVSVVEEQRRIHRAIAEIDAAGSDFSVDRGWLSAEWNGWAGNQGGVVAAVVDKIAEWQEWAADQGGFAERVATCYCRLTQVSATGEEFDDSWLERLPKRHLEGLRLNSCPMRGTGLHSLARAPHLTYLNF